MPCAQEERNQSGGRPCGGPAVAAGGADAPRAEEAGARVEQAVGIGPETPAGSGRGIDGGAAAVGGAAAAVSTGNAGAAAVVVEHVGQTGEPSGATAAGSGEPAAAEGAASGVSPVDSSNLMEKEKDEVGGGSARSASSQVNDEPVNATDARGSDHELAEC